MASLATALVIGTTVVSTAMQVVGSIQQGNAEARAADFNAAVNRNNALTATRVAAANVEEQRRRANLVMGRQAAAIGQADIGFGGSAADVMRQSAINAALDQLNERYQGQLEAQGYNQKANLLEYQGRQSQIGGYLGAGTAILSGASNYGTLPGAGRSLINRVIPMPSPRPSTLTP